MKAAIVGAIALAILIACSPADRAQVTIYKSPSCGCCSGYAQELQKNGFKVNIIETEDMASVKKQHNIPPDMESCHTMIINSYFVEGHVPLQAVKKMLNEKPDIDGIALPRMPSGTPGMPGPKTGKWEVYSLKDGEKQDFMTI